MSENIRPSYSLPSSGSRHDAYKKVSGSFKGEKSIRSKKPINAKNLHAIRNKKENKRCQEKKFFDVDFVNKQRAKLHDLKFRCERLNLRDLRLRDSLELSSHVSSLWNKVSSEINIFFTDLSEKENVANVSENNKRSKRQYKLDETGRLDKKELSDSLEYLALRVSFLEAISLMLKSETDINALKKARILLMSDLMISEIDVMNRYELVQETFSSQDDVIEKLEMGRLLEKLEKIGNLFVCLQPHDTGHISNDERPSWLTSLHKKAEKVFRNMRKISEESNDHDFSSSIDTWISELCVCLEKNYNDALLNVKRKQEKYISIPNRALRGTSPSEDFSKTKDTHDSYSDHYSSDYETCTEGSEYETCKDEQSDYKKSESEYFTAEDNEDKDSVSGSSLYESTKSSPDLCSEEDHLDDLTDTLKGLSKAKSMSLKDVLEHKYQESSKEVRSLMRSFSEEEKNAKWLADLIKSLPEEYLKFIKLEDEEKTSNVRLLDKVVPKEGCEKDFEEIKDFAERALTQCMLEASVFSKSAIEKLNKHKALGIKRLPAFNSSSRVVSIGEYEKELSLEILSQRKKIVYATVESVKDRLCEMKVRGKLCLLNRFVAAANNHNKTIALMNNYNEVLLSLIREKMDFIKSFLIEEKNSPSSSEELVTVSEEFNKSLQKLMFDLHSNTNYIVRAEKQRFGLSENINNLIQEIAFRKLRLSNKPETVGGSRELCKELCREKRFSEHNKVFFSDFGNVISSRDFIAVPLHVHQNKKGLEVVKKLLNIKKREIESSDDIGQKLKVALLTARDFSERTSSSRKRVFSSVKRVYDEVERRYNDLSRLLFCVGKESKINVLGDILESAKECYVAINNVEEQSHLKELGLYKEIEELSQKSSSLTKGSKEEVEWIREKSIKAIEEMEKSIYECLKAEEAAEAIWNVLEADILSLAKQDKDYRVVDYIDIEDSLSLRHKEEQKKVVRLEKLLEPYRGALESALDPNSDAGLAHYDKVKWQHLEGLHSFEPGVLDIVRKKLAEKDKDFERTYRMFCILDGFVKEVDNI